MVVELPVLIQRAPADAWSWHLLERTCGVRTLRDPFIHKGKIMVLIPKARTDMQWMLTAAFVDGRVYWRSGISRNLGKRKGTCCRCGSPWYHPSVIPCFPAAAVPFTSAVHSQLMLLINPSSNAAPAISLLEKKQQLKWTVLFFLTLTLKWRLSVKPKMKRLP